MRTQKICVTPNWFKQAGYELRGDETCKRILDLVLCVLTLPFLLPAAIIVSILIFVTDGRPMVFAQTRMGRGNRPFRLYKFRTIQNGKEKKSTLKRNDQSLKRWLISIGLFLRESRLDEIPQWVNILKGDMSWVGPRPSSEIVYNYIVKNFHKSVVDRFKVKPGLISVKDIMEKSITSYKLYRIYRIIITLDREYIKNYSVKKDLRMVLAQIKIILSCFLK